MRWRLELSHSVLGRVMLFLRLEKNGMDMKTTQLNQKHISGLALHLIFHCLIVV